MQRTKLLALLILISACDDSSVEVGQLDPETAVVDASIDPDSARPDGPLPDSLLPDAALPDAAIPDAAPDGPLPDAEIIEPDTGPPAPLLPDLMLLEDRLLDDLWLDEREFTADSCGIVEGCVKAPGKRLLLRFGVATANVGDADLFFGDPEEDQRDLFEYGECHEHYHFEAYARYALRDLDENVIEPGHKQAFCLLDSEKFLTEDPAVRNRARYNCGYQGISRGWQDTYHSRLDCQWVDVTDVDPGEYLLEVRINPDRIIPEKKYTNNDHTIAVRVPAFDLEQDCRGDEREDLYRVCGWTKSEPAMCEQGDLVEVSAGACGLGGECVTDGMLRICEGVEQCLRSSDLGQADNSCDSTCPYVSFACPESGVYTVWTAGKALDDEMPVIYETRAGPPPPVDEPCGNNAEDGLGRSCGWDVTLDNVECTGGFTYRVGCAPEGESEACGVGDACQGDTMVRVCPDGFRCTNLFAMAQNDDNCGGRCSATTFECPDTGHVTVLTAPYEVGGEYVCNAVLERIIDAAEPPPGD